MHTGGNVLVRLAGPFRLEAQDGVEVTPPGKRSKALVAMLALAPKAVRSRSWLQDHLWSDRAPAQAAASLRQELSSLRRFLGEHGADVLTTDRDTVRLDLERVRLDIEADDLDAATQELLEGLDICDAEFEDWLRVERARWRERAEALIRSHAVVAVDAAAAERARPVLGLVVSCAPAALAAGNYLMDVLTQALLGFEVIDVADFRSHTETGATPPATGGIDWVLRVNISCAHDRLIISAHLGAVGEAKLLWSHAGHLTIEDVYRPDSIAVGAFVNRIVFRTLDLIENPRSLRESRRHEAARCALGAIYQIFRLGDRDLDAADNLLAQAHALEPRSSFLGWRIMVAITRIGERRARRTPAFDEQVRDLMVRAVDSDPYNALTLALTAHAHSFIFHEYEYALGLLNRATDVNPTQPIAWDMRALTLGYLGETKRGYADALRARSIGPPPPYEFLVDATCCVLATLNGNYAEGITHGRRAFARKPNFMPALRYMAACEGHLGRTVDASRTLQRLRTFEPDFTIAMLRQPDYPVAGVLGATVIEKGLSGLALAHHVE